MRGTDGNFCHGQHSVLSVGAAIRLWLREMWWAISQKQGVGTPSSGSYRTALTWLQGLHWAMVSCNAQLDYLMLG